MSEELREKSNFPGEIPAEDYPFFTATPVKTKATGWKVLCLVLTAALAVSGYLLWSGWSFRQDGQNADPELDGRLAALQTRVDTLESEKAELQSEVEKLTGQNTSQANRIIELLNQCNNLSMKLEQAKNGTLSQEDIAEISNTIEAYELLIEANVALLQGDRVTLETCVRQLVQEEKTLPANARTALYVLLEYMDQ